MKIIKILTIILFFHAATASAHECESCEHRWWMNLGLGAGTTFNNDVAGKSGGGAVQLSFNGMLSDHMFLTFARTTVFKNDDDYASDVGLLVGYKSKKPNWYWSTSAGLSYYYYKTQVHSSWYNYPNYGWNSYSHTKGGAGVPVEAQLFWTPLKHFGVGLIGHGLVSKNPYAVAMLGLQIS